MAQPVQEDSETGPAPAAETARPAAGGSEPTGPTPAQEAALVAGADESLASEGSAADGPQAEAAATSAPPADGAASPVAAAAAESAAPKHPLAARGSHVSGAELFGADVADAEGNLLGRLFDLHVKPDGALDCLVLIGGDARHAYSGVDLALDDQGGLRLVSGERCDPNGPQRDGAPYRELFVDRQTSTVVGQLTAVEALEGSNPTVTVIKLRAANNHHHRVLVGPTAFLTEHDLALAVDQEVSIDGIETRDSRGKLWVAGALRTGGHELRLRSGNGQPIWDPSLLPIRQDDCCRDLDGSALSTFDLAQWRVRIEGAPELVPCDLVFDRQLEVEFLVLHHEGVERLVPWSATAVDSGRTLALEVGPAVIAAAPTLPQVTADDHDPWQGVRDWWVFAARPIQAAAPAAEPEKPAAQAPQQDGEPQADGLPTSDGANRLEPPDGAQR